MLSESDQSTPCISGGRSAPNSARGRSASMPNASPTGSEYRAPSWVAIPNASSGRFRIASCQPWSASRMQYGIVALVSALVDVTGTDPGMLVTQ